MWVVFDRQIVPIHDGETQIGSVRSTPQWAEQYVSQRQAATSIILLQERNSVPLSYFVSLPFIFRFFPSFLDKISHDVKF